MIIRDKKVVGVFVRFRAIVGHPLLGGARIIVTLKHVLESKTMPKQELLQFAMVVVHHRLLSKEYKNKKKL
jgi:hypothetical protein